MRESYKLCHRCHLSGKPPQMFFRASSWAYYTLLLYIVYDNFIQRALLIVIAFIMIYNNIYINTPTFFSEYNIRWRPNDDDAYSHIQYTRILYIYTNRMNGKITRARRFSSLLYTYI